MEKLLQYAWQHRLWKSPEMLSTDGQPIEVLNPGWLNTDSGPDFFNAKVKIGGKVWAGNIEIHVKASDWFRHGHHNDPAYESVILHVVENSDTEIPRRNGHGAIPQVVIQCRNNLVTFYRRLLDGENLPELICLPYVKKVEPVYLNSWIDALAYERIYEKSERFNAYLKATSNDWEQALFAALSRAIGFGHNSDSLERLALSFPLRIAGKHSDSPIALHALLLGQASLIDTEKDVVVRERLREEYRFLANKFRLTPLSSPAWKMGRMRPQNLPQRRISLLVSYLRGGFRLFSNIMESVTVNDLRNVIVSPINENMSAQSVDSLIINVAVPAIFTFGTATGNESLTERAISILHELPGENNTIVRCFENAGIECHDAYTSQAMIRLKRVYCENRKCLFCRIGNRMLRTDSTETSI